MANVKIYIKDKKDFKIHYRKRINNILKERVFWWQNKEDFTKVNIQILAPIYRTIVRKELLKIKD